MSTIKTVAVSLVEAKVGIEGIEGLFLTARLGLCADDGSFRWFIEKPGNGGSQYTYSIENRDHTVDGYPSIDEAIGAMKAHLGDDLFEITASQIASVAKEHIGDPTPKLVSIQE